MIGSSVFSAVVNFTLTFSFFFPPLMDLRRKRLSGWLTPLQRAPNADKYEENNERDAIAAACVTAIPAARGH
jgi:hypothetical protein